MGSSFVYLKFLVMLVVKAIMFYPALYLPGPQINLLAHEEGGLACPPVSHSSIVYPLVVQHG
jgi:hypothetical protein